MQDDNIREDEGLITAREFTFLVFNVVYVVTS
jgi:hypothetical protein